MSTSSSGDERASSGDARAVGIQPSPHEQRVRPVAVEPSGHREQAPPSSPNAASSARSVNTLEAGGLAPDVVQRALLEDPAVAECAVLARDDGCSSQELVAYVVPSGSFVPQQLERRLGDRLPPLWVPVAALARTSWGQIDEQALRRLEVLDDRIAERWETELGSCSEIEEVAVVVEPESIAPIPRCHLSDLLGEGQASRNRAAGAVGRTPDPPAADIPPCPKAISDGGEIPMEGVPANLSGVLQRASEQSPDKGILYLEEDGSERFVSYPELLDEARRLLAGLRARGLEPGDKVLFQLDRREDFLPALWACFVGGFVAVPAAIAPSYEELNRPISMLHNAWRMLAKPLVLSGRRLAPQVSGIAELLDLEGFEVAVLDELRHGRPERRYHPAEPDDLALLLLTSGSTGRPKAVMHSHRSVLSRQASATSWTGFTRDEISLNWLPLDHVASLIQFHIRDVFLGCQQIQAPTDRVLGDPLRWLDLIDRYRVTVTWAPHFGYALVAEQAAEIEQRQWDLSCLRYALNGGEAIVARSARRFLELLIPHGLPPNALRPVWGMSETAAGATCSPHFDLETTSDDDPFVEVGEPLYGVRLRIVDEHRQIVEEGTPGELQVQGPMVTSGYYGRPELNREAFTEDGWLRTGDLAVLDHGRLTITGREKDVIIVHGINYPSQEIESVVDEIDGVQVSYTAACGVRLPDKPTDQLAIFFHSSLADRQQDLAAQLEEIRRRVWRRCGLRPDYLLPLSKAEIPKTSVGKIQRARLKERFESGEFDDLRRRIELLAGNADGVPDWFFRKLWRRQEIAAAVPVFELQRLLIFVDLHGLGEALLESLRDSGIAAVGVEAGDGFALQDDGRYMIDPHSPDDYRRLLGELRAREEPIDGAVDLWSYGESTVASGASVQLENTQRGSRRLLELFQALAADRRGDQTLPLWVVSSHSQAIADDDHLALERTPMAALVEVAAQEIPQLRCRHLDLPVELPERNLERLLAELKAPAGEPEVAYRENQRLVPRFEPVDFEARPPQSLPFKKRGVYVITGGLGGLGVIVARYLLERYQARLLLVGRTPLTPSDPAAGRARLEELARLGGEVVYEAADLGDEVRFLELAQQALERWGGQLDGIFHLAAQFHEAPLVGTSEEQLHAVMRAKVAGSWALGRLIDGRPAFLIAFSSVYSYFATANTGAYAAANRYLEAFCRQLATRHPGDVYCFVWGMWDGIGISRGHQNKELMQARGYELIGAQQGLNSLLAGLASGQPELWVGLNGSHPQIARHLAQNPEHPLQRLRAYYTLATGAPCPPQHRPRICDRFGNPTHCELQEVEEFPRTASGEIDRGRLAALDRTVAQGEDSRPQGELERFLAALFQEILGVEQVGRDDHFFKLGGHSILATQLLSRLRDLQGVLLPLPKFLAGPTVAQLARKVEGRLPAEKSVGAAASRVSTGEKQEVSGI